MFPNNNQILLYYKTIDMRKGINGLSILIADEIAMNPSDGCIFLFYNKTYDKLKCIYWDRNGFCLFYKFLTKDRFKIPKMLSSRTISHEQLRWLFDGLDIDKISGFKALKFSHFF